MKMTSQRLVGSIEELREENIRGGESSQDIKEMLQKLVGNSKELKEENTSSGDESSQEIKRALLGLVGSIEELRGEVKELRQVIPASVSILETEESTYPLKYSRSQDPPKITCEQILNFSQCGLASITPLSGQPKLPQILSMIPKGFKEGAVLGLGSAGFCGFQCSNLDFSEIMMAKLRKNYFNEIHPMHSILGHDALDPLFDDFKNVYLDDPQCQYRRSRWTYTVGNLQAAKSESEVQRHTKCNDTQARTIILAMLWYYSSSLLEKHATVQYLALVNHH
jgi:hypothetical protein